MSTKEQITVSTMTANQYRAWREGCEPLHVDIQGDRVLLHVEPDSDLSGAYEAITATFARLLSFECAQLQSVIEEGY